MMMKINYQDKYLFQQCQDDKVNEAFRKFHHHLIQEIIDFCIKHNITIDEVHLSADCMKESIEKGSWQPSMDSSFIGEKYNDDYWKQFYSDMTDEDWKQYEALYKPFIISE